MLEAQKNSGMGRENQISSDLNCSVFRFRFEFFFFFFLFTIFCFLRWYTVAPWNGCG